MVLDFGQSNLFGNSRDLQEGFSTTTEGLASPKIFMGNAQAQPADDIDFGTTRYFGFGLFAHQASPEIIYMMTPREGKFKNFTIQILANNMDDDTTVSLVNNTTADEIPITFSAAETGIKKSTIELDIPANVLFYIKVDCTASGAGRLLFVFATVEFY